VAAVMPMANLVLEIIEIILNGAPPRHLNLNLQTILGDMNPCLATVRSKKDACLYLTLLA